MSVPVNGTDAKDVALHFINATMGRATPMIVRKTIGQAKTLLGSGYSKDEVIQVIDKCVSKGVDMYSLGYVSACINDVLREVQEDKEKAKAQVVKKQYVEHQQAEHKEVKVNGESTRRNQEKAKRLGIQSRFGEKFNFDMFEGK